LLSSCGCHLYLKREDAKTYDNANSDTGRNCFSMSHQRQRKAAKKQSLMPP